MIQRNGDNGNGKKARKNPGPPPTWTREKIDVILRAVSIGHSMATAAALVGHKKTTVDNWFARNPDLRAELQLARGNMADRAIGKLWEHIEKDSWPALERLLKTRVAGFADKSKTKNENTNTHRVEGPEYATPTHETEDGERISETDEQYFKRLMALAKQQSGDGKA